MAVQYNLECLSLAGFFQAILTFASKTKKLKVLTLVTNIRLAWKAFKGKYSSLFCPTNATRFPAKSNVCGWGQEPTLELSNRKVLYSGTLRTYPQTINKAGKARQGQAT